MARLGGAWARVARGLVGAALAGALVLAGPIGGPRPAAAQEPLFVPDGEIELEGNISAVAVNADEAILAAASPVEDAARVVLLDRRSRAPLGRLRAEVGAVAGLRFAPDRDLLLVWGERALEVWRISVTALSMDEPLSLAHRLWRQPLEGDPPVSDAAFLVGAGAVVWSRADALYSRALTPGAAPTDEPLMTLEAPVTGLAAHPAEPRLAVSLEGDKRVIRLQGVPPENRAEWSLHRFPVTAAAYLPDGRLMTLDRGRNAVLWSGDGEAERADFVKSLPADAVPTRTVPLAADRWLALWSGEAGETLGAVSGAPARLDDTLSVAAPPAVAVSPTGRYVVDADETVLRIHRFAGALAPADYVRHLRGTGAGETALTYVRMLDPEAVPETERRAAEQELARAPAESVLGDLLRRLRDALAAGDPEAVAEAARQVLNREPEHPEALQALRQLQTLRDRRVLEEAQQAYDAGSYRRAIALLSTEVEEDSPLYAEAGALIAEAEARRDLESLLVQAREKMELQLYGAAETLVNEALRQDAGNAAALALQDEIASRSGENLRTFGAMGVGGLLALGIVGVLLYRVRRRSRTAARQAPPHAEPRRRVRPMEEPGAATRTRAGGAAEAVRGAARGSNLRRAVRFNEAAERLRATEEMARLCRQADKAQRHTAFLLEVEAELSTLNRRLSEQNTDPDRLLQRIEAIRGELRGLSFESGEGGQGARPPEDVDYYALLEVPLGASPDQIKAAYHRLIKDYHPDRHSGSEFGWIREEAERKSRLIGEAYHVLSDTERRARYDRELARRRRSAR